MRSRGETSKKMDLDGFFRALRILMKEGRKRWRPELQIERHIRIYGPKHRVQMVACAPGNPVYFIRYRFRPITALCFAQQIKTGKRSKEENSMSVLEANQECLGQQWLGLSKNICYDIINATDTPTGRLRSSRVKKIRRRLLRTLGLKEKK